MTAKLFDFVIRGKIEGNYIKAEAAAYLQYQVEHMYDVEDVEMIITERPASMSIDAMTGNED